MKKSIFLAITLSLICAVTCFGQERVNRGKLSFDNSGPILNNITGWSYDETVGEWVNYKGVLVPGKGKYNSGIAKSFHFNNIISLQFKTLTYNNVQYYILIWAKWEGAYKYPYIHVDWEWWKTKNFMMFTKEDMNKLKNLTNEPITIEVPTLSRTSYANTISDEDVIQKEMGYYLDHVHQRKCSIVIYKATDGAIRFMFDDDVYNYNSINKQYFEITETDYSLLLNVGF